MRPRSPILREWLWAPPLVSLAVSVTAIARPSFWHDEAATLSATTRALPDMFRMLGNVDAVHGIYYVLLHPVVAAFGSSEVAVRMGSAVAIAAATLATGALGARIVGARMGLLSGLVFALLPVTSHYGMEARSPALACALIGWATFALVVAYEEGESRVRIWAVYTVLMLLATWVFMYSLLILAAHWVTSLALRRPSRRALAGHVVATGIVLALSAPLLVVAAGQSGQIGWIATVTPQSVVKASSSWVLPWLVQGLAADLAAGLLVVCLWALAVGAVVLAGRGVRAGAAPEGPALLLRVCLPWLLVPVGTLIVGSLVKPMFAGRYVFFSTPAFALLIGYSFWLLKPRRRAVLVGLGLLLLALPSMYSDRQPMAKGDLRPISEILGENAQGGDAVLFSPSSRRRMMAAYPQGFDKVWDISLGQSPIQSGTLTGTEVTNRELARRLGGVNRLWLVFGDGDNLTDLPASKARILRENSLVEARSWDGLRGQVVLLERQ